jgi:AraC-like DNA-binding protein
MTDPLPYTDAFMVGIQLKSLPHHELWFDGRAIDVNDVACGDTIFYDLRRDPRAYLTDRSHSLHVNLTHGFMAGIASDLDLPGAELDVPSGVPQRDRVLHKFGRSLLPLFDISEEVSALFSSHLMLALGIYVGVRFGGFSRPPAAGCLGAAELRLAKEMIRADLTGGTEIRVLANACRMPASRFAAAFRASTGMSPYQWLAIQRLQLAKSLLQDTQWPVKDVAPVCGYADARHFSREFREAVGYSPSAFRSTL